jgi:hypothetical protein
MAIVRSRITTLAADGHAIVAAAARPHLIGVSAAEAHVSWTRARNRGEAG